MESNERYYRRRAVEERMAARRAISETARAWHAKLAEDFAERAASACTPVSICTTALINSQGLPSALNEAPVRFMEDWEEFFAEKSRRRALTVRRRSSFKVIRYATFCILFFAACVMLVMFLTK